MPVFFLAFCLVFFGSKMLKLRCCSLRTNKFMHFPLETHPMRWSGVTDRWEPLDRAEKASKWRSWQTRLDWTDLGQAGGGPRPGCYSDQPAISESGGGSNIWDPAFWMTPMTLLESALSWCPPLCSERRRILAATVTLPDHSGVFACLAKALSICCLPGHIPLSGSWLRNQDWRLQPATDDTFKALGHQLWEALAAVLHSHSRLSLQAKKWFSSLEQKLKSVEEKHNNQVLKKPGIYLIYEAH